MKNPIYVLLTVVVLGFVGCKREENLLPLDSQFIKNVTVAGASAVRLDNDNATIQITLPESHTSDLVMLNLTLYTGATLDNHFSSDLYTTNTVSFYFKGFSPEHFSIRRNDITTITKAYTVYVEHTGKMDAELTSEILIHPLSGENSDYSTASIRIKSGVGTIPERPDSRKNIIPKLLDKDQAVTGIYDVGIHSLHFEKTYQLLASKNLSLQLSYGDKEFTFPSVQTITRAALQASVNVIGLPFNPLPNKGMATISGGYFLKEKPYKVKIENDFQQAPLWVNATFQNQSLLAFKIPSHLQDGNYLVGIYEDDELISARGIIISNATGSKGIGLMWTTDHQCPTDTLFDSVPSRIRLQKSQKVYVNLFPMMIQDANQGFNPNQRLPDLELKNSAFTAILKPLVRVDRCYGDHATYVYFGEYQIPAEISSGKYEARLIFSEYGHSLPYWNVLNIY